MNHEVFNKPSNSISIATIFLAIHKALDFQQLTNPLLGGTNIQREVIQHYKRNVSQIPILLRDPSVKCMAGQDHHKLNAFIKENEGTLEFNKITPPDFGVVGLFNILREYDRKAQKTNLVDIEGHDHGEDSGIAFNDMVHHASTNSVSVFSTGGMYRVIITPVDEYYEGFELYKKSLDIMRRPNEINSSTLEMGYDAVIIPSVSIHHKPDISDLVVRMNIGKAYVSEAKQENVFNMNHKGFKAISITTLKMRKGMTVYKNPLKLNGSNIITLASNNLGAGNNIPLLSVQSNKDIIGCPEL